MKNLKNQLFLDRDYSLFDLLGILIQFSVLQVLRVLVIKGIIPVWHNHWEITHPFLHQLQKMHLQPEVVQISFFVMHNRHSRAPMAHLTR